MLRMRPLEAMRKGMKDWVRAMMAKRLVSKQARASSRSTSRAGRVQLRPLSYQSVPHPRAISRAIISKGGGRCGQRLEEEEEHIRIINQNIQLPPSQLLNLHPRLRNTLFTRNLQTEGRHAHRLQILDSFFRSRCRYDMQA